MPRYRLGVDSRIARPLTLAAAALVAPSRWRLPTAIVGGGFVLAVSLALMIQGWHFPGDVLAGLLISTTTSLLVARGPAGDRRDP